MKLAISFGPFVKVCTRKGGALSHMISTLLSDFVITFSDAAGVNDHETNGKRPQLRLADIEKFAEDSD